MNSIKTANCVKFVITSDFFKNLAPFSMHYMVYSNYYYWKQYNNGYSIEKAKTKTCLKQLFSRFCNINLSVVYVYASALLNPFFENHSSERSAAIASLKS